MNSVLEKKLKEKQKIPEWNWKHNVPKHVVYRKKKTVSRGKFIAIKITGKIYIKKHNNDLMKQGKTN